MKRAICILLLATFCVALLASCAPQAEEQAAQMADTPQRAARHIDARGAKIVGDGETEEQPPQEERTGDDGAAQLGVKGVQDSTSTTTHERTQNAASSAASSGTTAQPAATPRPKATSTSAPVTASPKPTAKQQGSQSPTTAVETPGPDAGPAATPTQSVHPSASAPKASNQMACTIAIDCATAIAVEPALANAVSSNGVILAETSVTLENGKSVYDALAASGVTFAGAVSYVTSINSIGEGDCGAGSGWMYSVNGTFPKTGCNNYKLKDGDKVAWRYTCNTGKDIDARF